MYKKRARQLSAQLLRQLSTKSAAATLRRDRGEMAALLSAQGYLQRLEDLLNGEGRLTCAAVLERCRDTLECLSPVPAEGWLAGIYQYACAAMFPSEDNEELRRACAPAAFFFLTLLQVLFPNSKSDDDTVDFGGFLAVSCYHIGALSNVADTYERMLLWAQQHRFALRGDCCERYVLDIYSTPRQENYVTEVLLPVAEDTEDFARLNRWKQGR